MSIHIEKNDIPAAQEEEIYQPVRMNKLRVVLRDEALTELDVSGIGFGAEGAPLVAKYISGNRALFSVDVSDNHIPADKLQEIDQAVRSNRLRPICEDSNKSLLEIDLSSRYLDAKDAIVVAEYIKDSGTMTSLSLASNGLHVEGAKIIAAVFPQCT
jgi:Ran GTPase-activating protein (RanGAP) involved in mRNA processing and transport